MNKLSIKHFEQAGLEVLTNLISAVFENKENLKCWKDASHIEDCYDESLDSNTYAVLDAYLSKAKQFDSFDKQMQVFNRAKYITRNVQYRVNFGMCA